MGRLSSVHARCTMRVLKPEAWHLSPCVGLIMRNSPTFMASLHRCRVADELDWGLGSACNLSRELFMQPRGVGDALRATRTKSQPATWISSSTMGHVLGLVLRGASQEESKALLQECGIRTNRLHGQWTGVSFARYQRLITLLREACCEDERATPALPLLLCWVWLQAESKACLLDFLLAVDTCAVGGCPLDVRMACLTSYAFLLSRSQRLSDRTTPSQAPADSCRRVRRAAPRP